MAGESDVIEIQKDVSRNVLLTHPNQSEWEETHHTCPVSRGKSHKLKDLTDEKFMSSQRMNLPWQTELSQMVIYFSPSPCVCSSCNCPGDHPIFIFNCGKHEKLTHSDTVSLTRREREKTVIFNWEQLDNLLHVHLHFSYFFFKPCWQGNPL